jgi:hypothetical protein
MYLPDTDPKSPYPPKPAAYVTFEELPDDARLFYIFHTGQFLKLPVAGQEGDRE